MIRGNEWISRVVRRIQTPRTILKSRTFDFNKKGMLMTIMQRTFFSMGKNNVNLLPDIKVTKMI